MAENAHTWESLTRECLDGVVGRYLSEEEGEGIFSQAQRYDFPVSGSGKSVKSMIDFVVLAENREKAIRDFPHLSDAQLETHLENMDADRLVTKAVGYLLTESLGRNILIRARSQGLPARGSGRTVETMIDFVIRSENPRQAIRDFPRLNDAEIEIFISDLAATDLIYEAVERGDLTEAQGENLLTRVRRQTIPGDGPGKTIHDKIEEVLRADDKEEAIRNFSGLNAAEIDARQAAEAKANELVGSAVERGDLTEAQGRNILAQAKRDRLPVSGSGKSVESMLEYVAEAGNKPDAIRELDDLSAAYVKAYLANRAWRKKAGSIPVDSPEWLVGKAISHGDITEVQGRNILAQVKRYNLPATGPGKTAKNMLEYVMASRNKEKAIRNFNRLTDAHIEAFRADRARIEKTEEEIARIDADIEDDLDQIASIIRKELNSLSANPVPSATMLKALLKLSKDLLARGILKFNSFVHHMVYRLRAMIDANPNLKGRIYINP